MGRPQGAKNVTRKGWGKPPPLPIAYDANDLPVFDNLDEPDELFDQLKVQRQRIPDTPDATLNSEAGLAAMATESVNVIHYVGYGISQAGLQQAARVLKPKGKFIFVLPTDDAKEQTNPTNPTNQTNQKSAISKYGRRLPPHNLEGQKPCGKCNVNKDFSAFGRNVRRPDGLQTWCKECRKEYTRRWRQEMLKRRAELNRGQDDH